MPSLSHNQWTILQAVLSTLLYGVYSVIFLGCLYIFFSQYNEAQHKRLVLINIVLFLLCTAQWASFFLLALLTTDPVSDYTAAVKQAYVKDILVDLNSLANTAAVCTADGLLIWRCRKIWGGRLSVVVLPILVLIVGAGCGIVNFVTITIQIAMQHANALADSSPPPLWFTLANISADVEVALAAASFLVNMLMTVLIGARIWWKTRGLNEMFGRNQRKEYIRVILVVLESGAVYSLLLLLSMIFTALAGDSANKYNDYTNTINSISFQVVGIFPTAILLLVRLGFTSENATNSAGTGATLSRSMQFAPRQAINIAARDEGVQELSLGLSVMNGPKQHGSRNPGMSSSSDAVGCLV